jgi:catechol 2,3-dioxygenase-like lactoylglutathione lyase family enzyme
MRVESGMPGTPPLVPELDVSDLDRSLSVYIDVLGFKCHVSRPEDRFAYLIREGVHLMLEEAAGPGRRFHTAPLEYPFGRGMNLQIEVVDVDVLYASVQQAGLSIVIPLEERWYRQDQTETGNRQFVTADPDGYLLRFFRDLGRRPIAGAAA